MSSFRKAPRRSRFGAKAAHTTDLGTRNFYARSKLEHTHARNLEQLRLAGAIADWKAGGKSFHFPGRKVAPVTYRPDFVITMPNGAVVYDETKGTLQRRDVTKMRLMAKHYPDVDVRMIGTRLPAADRAKVEATRAKAIADREKAERKARKVGV
jgi:hypothetical protein